MKSHISQTAASTLKIPLVCRGDDEEQRERMRTRKNVLLEDLHLFISLYHLLSLKCQIFQLLRWKSGVWPCVSSLIVPHFDVTCLAHGQIVGVNRIMAE